jgi:hypothetical protein
VPVDTAERNGIGVEEYRDEHCLEVAVDYRPHSHHWQVMKPVREDSPTESSTTELDGLKVCNFMTTWGDGLFQVYRDLGGSGELAQIRIELEENAHFGCSTPCPVYRTRTRPVRGFHA